MAVAKPHWSTWLEGKRIVAAAQCLDNQWRPPEIDARPTELFADLRRSATAREFNGALLASEHLVVNRAFAINNDYLASLYMSPAHRDFLQALVSEAAIALFFFNEDSVDQPPRFQHDSARLKALAAVAEKGNAVCLRLDWDDASNKAQIRNKFARAFHSFVATLDELEPAVLARDFGLAPGPKEAFKQRLRAVKAFADKKLAATDDDFITRDEIYNKFVVPEGDVLGSQNDPAKPFAAEIRKLVDLKYNLNLSDALQIFGLTAAGDIDRTVLQEISLGAANRGYLATEDDEILVSLLSSCAFDRLNTFDTLSFLGELSLLDLIQLRNTDEWEAYIRSVSEVLLPQQQLRTNLSVHPFLKAENQARLVATQADLLRCAAARIRTRQLEETATVWCEVTLSVVGTGLKLVSYFAHHEHHIELSLLELVAHTSAPVLVEFCFGYHTPRGQRRFLRKFPLIEARVREPSHFFKRVTDEVKRVNEGRAETTIDRLDENAYRKSIRQPAINDPAPD